MTRSTLRSLIRLVDGAVEAGGTEQVITRNVAAGLRSWLAAGPLLDIDYRRPDPDRYVLHPLHVDAGGRFSIASAVWNVGQCTPVHGHETWGVVGIYSGVEHEVSYVKPRSEGTAPVEAETADWKRGDVTVCCTTDDDVHRVSCVGEEPCVGIHVYGADIGTLRRRSYDPVDGSVTWFVSSWSGLPPLGHEHAR